MPRKTAIQAFALAAICASAFSVAAKPPPDPKVTAIPNLLDDANKGQRPDSMIPDLSPDTAKINRPPSAIPDLRTSKQKETAEKTKNQAAGALISTPATQAYAFRTKLNGDPHCQRFAQESDAVFLDPQTSTESKATVLTQIGKQASAAGCVSSQ